MEFQNIAQEVRVWGALKNHSGDAYAELWDAFDFDYSNKGVDLPDGAVKKIAEGTNEDSERNYIIFKRIDGSKTYRLDSEVGSSWDSERTIYPPYEVVAKEVTEIRYTKV